MFLAFLGLTVVMTWPWVPMSRPLLGPRDPYLGSWALWWDFHQTFHDPLHLFDGNVFFPITEPRVQRAQLRHRAAVLPAPRARGAPADRAGTRDAARLRVLGVRRLPAGADAAGSTGAAWVTGISVRVRAVSLRPVPHLNTFLRVDPGPPRSARSLRARANEEARGLARRVLLERARRHPLGSSSRSSRSPRRVSSSHSAMGPSGTVQEGARPSRSACRDRPPAVPPPLSESREALRLHARHPRDARLLRRAETGSTSIRAIASGGLQRVPVAERACLFPGLLFLALPLAALLLRARRATRPGSRGSPASPQAPLAGRDLDRRRAPRALRREPDGHPCPSRGKEVFRATESSRALAVFAAALSAVVDRLSEVAPFRARANLPRKPGSRPRTRSDPRRRRLGRSRLLRLARRELRFHRLLFETSCFSAASAFPRALR